MLYNGQLTSNKGFLPDQTHLNYTDEFDAYSTVVLWACQKITCSY